MSVKDVIKKSVLNSFVSGQAMTAESVMSIVLNMVIALCMGMLIYFIYKKYFQGVIYSRTFALTLVGMCVLTCMVTLAISTNIVISLGMVGALSIVRYRTAVKEPLDLLYLFWAITTGITVGAGMYLLAVCGAVIMIAMILIFVKKTGQTECYMMIIHSTLPAEGETDGERLEQQLKNIFGKTRYSVKSQVLRRDAAETTLQFSSRETQLSLGSAVRELAQVTDVTVIKYNGEYHG